MLWNAKVYVYVFLPRKNKIVRYTFLSRETTNSCLCCSSHECSETANLCSVEEIVVVDYTIFVLILSHCCIVVGYTAFVELKQDEKTIIYWKKHIKFKKAYYQKSRGNSTTTNMVSLVNGAPTRRKYFASKWWGIVVLFTWTIIISESYNFME